MRKFFGTAVIILALVFSGCTLDDPESAAPVLVSSVTLNKTVVDLSPGQSETLIPEVFPANAADKTLAWSSSNEAAATVDSNGTVTVKPDAVPGTEIKITAASTDGSNKSAVCTVTVISADETILVSSVTLNKTAIELFPEQAETLIPEVLPADAADKTLAWSSSDEAAATVDSNGTVTVKPDAVPGTEIQITAASTDGSNKSDVCTVTVIAPPAGETTIGESSDIGGRLYLNDAPVFDYDEDSKAINPLEYEGTLNLTAGGWNVFYDYNNPVYLALSADITGNKLFFDINEVPPEKLSPLEAGLVSDPPGVKGAVVSSFFAFEENPTPVDYYIGMINKNNVEEQVVFIYAESDVKITGITWLYWELDLKAGWNSVKYDYKSLTVKTFVPDENYIWLNYSAASGTEAPSNNQIEAPQYLSKISGTLDVTADGVFPEGGVTVNASWRTSMEDQAEPLASDEIPSDTNNPAPWELSGFPLTEDWGIAELILDIFPEADKKTFYNYRPFMNQHHYDPVEIPPDPNDPDPSGPPEFEIQDVVLNPISISTMDVSVSVSGGGADFVYADDTPFSNQNNRNIYGRKTNGESSFVFKLPDTLGRNEDYPDENWLWFRVVNSGGQKYISKGRLNANESIVLNTADMYLEPED